MSKELPKYTANKMQGNIGEAYVQYLLSLFTLVHKIDGSNDVGNDFICELVHEQSPTNLLFYVQVKYTQDRPTIKQETWNYWKTSPIPVYIFWIRKLPGARPMQNIPIEDLEQNTQYLACTPLLHANQKYSLGEYRNYDRRDFQGDLVRDHARTAFQSGYATIVKPRDYLRLDEKIYAQLPFYLLEIEGMVPTYHKKILTNGWVNLYALATSLHRKGTQKAKKEAVKLLDVALNLMSSAEKIEYLDFRQKMQNLKISILNSMNQG